MRSMTKKHTPFVALFRSEAKGLARLALPDGSIEERRRICVRITRALQMAYDMGASAQTQIAGTACGDSTVMILGHVAATVGGLVVPQSIVAPGDA